jgi:hypothetical protein
MSPKIWLPVVLLLVAIVVVVVVARTPEAKHENVDRVEIATTRDVVASAPVPPPPVASTPTHVHARPRPPVQVEPAMPPSSPSTSASVSAGPRYADEHEVFDAQIDALRRDDDAAFRATFLPSMSIGAADIAACKTLVKTKGPIHPEWAARETATERGEKIVRVEILTHALTGFHYTKSGVLADRLWCAPPPRTL